MINPMAWPPNTLGTRQTCDALGCLPRDLLDDESRACAVPRRPWGIGRSPPAAGQQWRPRPARHGGIDGGGIRSVASPTWPRRPGRLDGQGMWATFLPLPCNAGGHTACSVPQAGTAGPKGPGIALEALQDRIGRIAGVSPRRVGAPGGAHIPWHDGARLRPRTSAFRLTVSSAREGSARLRPAVVAGAV